MKTKIIIIALASIAALSISASKFSSAPKETNNQAVNHSAPIGGLVTDAK